jgi:hypothetical protein
VYNAFVKAIDGVTNDWPSTQPSIVLQTVTYTPAQLVAKLKEVYAPLQAAVDAHSALQTALTTREDALPDAAQFIQDFFSVLPQYLPKGSAEVEKFGAKTKKKRAAMTAEAKVAANEKRQATRAARHIMGKKQRAAIKAPVPAPAPAPAAQAKTGS